MNHQEPRQDQSPLLDVPGAAEYLRVSGGYVRKLMRTGALPTVRLGRRTMVRRADLDALIAAGGTVPTKGG